MTDEQRFGERPKPPVATNYAEIEALARYLDAEADDWAIIFYENDTPNIVNASRHYMAGPHYEEEFHSVDELPAALTRLAQKFAAKVEQ